MTASTFDPAGWLARAAALGRHVEVVGRSVYFGRAELGAEADDVALFAELRAAGGAAVIREHLARRAASPASGRPALCLPPAPATVEIVRARP